MDELLIGLDGSCKARRSIKRVKTGCHTCKTRRVKCDEGRPSCWQCTSSRRECKGYGIWGGGGHPPGPITGMLDLCQPIGNLEIPSHLRLEDRRVLSWFTRRTLGKIQGLFAIPFWDVLVPQCCTTEPIILACVLALGSSHREKTNRHNEDSSRTAGANSSSLWYYGEAIKMLRSAQLDGSKHSTRIILIGCLLFIAIEYLQKRYSQGRLHLQNGLHILASQKSRGLLQSSGDSADDWLTDAFNRLDLQTDLLLYTAKDKDIPLHEQQVPEKSGLTSLGSLDEARSWIDYLMSQAFQLQRQSYSAEKFEDVAQLFQLSSRKRQLQQDLTSWLQAFRAFKPQPSCDWKEQIGYELLLVHHDMITIITGTSLSFHDEFIFDRYSSNFTSIITSCRTIVAAARVLSADRNLAHHSSTDLGFTTDMGIILPLYYTALKCRVGNTRHEALSMLRCQTHQEGIWDGSTAALIASEVVRLEENCVGETEGKDGLESARYEHQSDGPRYSRISDAWVELPSTPESELRLTVRRRSRNGTWTIEHRSYNGICWH